LSNFKKKGLSFLEFGRSLLPEKITGGRASTAQRGSSDGRKLIQKKKADQGKKRWPFDALKKEGEKKEKEACPFRWKGWQNFPVIQ